MRDRASRVYTNPFTAEVVRIQRAHELSAFYRWVDTADPLHFGDFGGLWTKLLWFAFGLALTGLVVTGTWLHLRRLADGSREPRARGAPGPRPAAAAAGPS